MVRDGVMTGRPHGTERGVAVAPFERVRRLEAAASREDRGLSRRAQRARVSVQVPAALETKALEVIEIRRRVHALEVCPGRPPRLEPEAGVGRGARVEPGEHGTHARRAFRMTATGVMLLEADVGRDQEHTARLTNHQRSTTRHLSRRYAWLPRCAILAPLRPHGSYARRR